MRGTSHRLSLRRGLLVLVAAVGLLALVGCGRTGSGDAEPAGIAPLSSPVHVEVQIDPQGAQEAAVREISRRFPGGEDPGAAVAGLVAQAFREGGTRLDYERDVKPWLGDRLGVFVSGLGADPPGGAPAGGAASEAAAVIATTDEDAALESARKALGGAQERSHEGVDYLLDPERQTAAGTIEGFLVIGSESGFKAAADASNDGASLGQDARYRDALATLGDDERLATFYFDTKRFVDLAVSQPGFAGPQGAGLRRLFGGPQARPGVAALRAEPDAVVLDSTLSGLPTIFASPAFGSATPLLSKLPSGSWLAVGQADLGGTLRGFLDALAGTPGFDRAAIEQQLRGATGLELERDLLAWIGDLGVFARGTSMAELAGGAVIESRAPSASRRALAGVARLLRRQGETRVRRASLPAADNGFQIRLPNAPQPLYAVQRRSRVVVAYGRRAATAALGGRATLEEDRGFRSAVRGLGPGYGPANYVAMAPILALAESLGARPRPGYARAKPYLERFEHLVAGTRREGDAVISRTRIELK